MGPEYPSWVYDPTGVNPPFYVTSDDQYVALLLAPDTTPPTLASALVKSGVVTIVTPPALARFVKDASFRGRRR